MLEDFFQFPVRLPRFGFDGVEFGHDFRNGTVGFGFAGMNIAAGRDVVVVLDNLGLVRNAAELVLFFPVQEGRGNPLKAVFRDVVLGVALAKTCEALTSNSLSFCASGLALLRKSRMPGAVVL